MATQYQEIPFDIHNIFWLDGGMWLLLFATAPIKLEIATIEKALATAPTADLSYRLALALLTDQEQDRAFLAFLDALNATEPQESWDFPEEALNAYLLGHTVAHSSDPSVNIFHAIALANRGEFAGFFTHFFTAYPHFKGTFLDFKTQATIYLRLSQRAYSKERYLQLAKECLIRALELEPRDSSIYRHLLHLEGDHASYLEKLCQSDVQLQRGDILPFVQGALRCGCTEIAERIVEKAKQRYSYSRAIEEAEKLLGREGCKNS